MSIKITELPEDKIKSELVSAITSYLRLLDVRILKSLLSLVRSYYEN